MRLAQGESRVGAAPSSETLKFLN